MEGTQDTEAVAEEELLVGFLLTGVTLPLSPYMSILLLPVLTPSLLSPLFLLLSPFSSSLSKLHKYLGRKGSVASRRPFQNEGMEVLR